MQVLDVVHACVNVSDVEEATRFFRDLLGFEIAWELEVPTELFARLHGVAAPRGRSVGLRSRDGGEIELFALTEPRGEPRSTRRFEDAGLSVLTLAVDDIEALVVRLREEGYEPAGEIVRFPALPRDLLSVHVEGPSGVPLTFTQWVDEEPTH